MKVRIGFSLGGGPVDAGAFADAVDALEDTGFDSLWLSERATGPAPDPLIGLAVAAGRTRRLKLGTSVMVVPGRNPVLLAVAIASLDVLSDGRMLPAFGLGVADASEQQAFGVAREERAAWLDEAVPLIRRLWSGEPVDHRGPRFSYEGVVARPRPVTDTLDVWLGGRAPAELRRTGRLGDGWLASTCTPDEAATGRRAVEEAATAAGRVIDPEHWGALVLYADGAVPSRAAATLARRRSGRDPGEVVAVGPDVLRRRIEQFVARGISKLVVAPVDGADARRVSSLADAVLDLQRSVG